MNELQTAMTIHAAASAGDANSFIYEMSSGSVLVAGVFVLLLLGIIVFTDIL